MIVFGNKLVFYARISPKNNAAASNLQNTVKSKNALSGMLKLPRAHFNLLQYQHLYDIQKSLLICNRTEIRKVCVTVAVA